MVSVNNGTVAQEAVQEGGLGIEAAEEQGYAPITRIWGKNFASYDSFDIDVPETGVLKINGYNNTGKSAILRGLAMVMLGRWQRDQQKFVKDGNDFFELGVDFADGVELYMKRISKRAGSGVVYELRKDGGVLFTTMSDRGMTAAKTIPDCFKRYLGLISSKTIDFNYRDRNDPPLLTGTTAKDNNESLNEVLKFSQIVEATDKMSTKVRDMNSEWNSKNGAYESMVMLVKEQSNVTQQAVEDAEMVARDAKALAGRSADLDTLDGYVGSIDMYAGVRNDDYAALVERADGVSARYSDLQRALGMVESGMESHVRSLGYSDLAGVQEQADALVDPLGDLSRLLNVYNSYNHAERAFQEKKRVYDGVQAELNAMNEEIRNEGGQLVKCPNCGQLVAVGIEH